MSRDDDTIQGRGMQQLMSSCFPRFMVIYVTRGLSTDTELRHKTRIVYCD